MMISSDNLGIQYTRNSESQTMKKDAKLKLYSSELIKNKIIDREKNAKTNANRLVFKDDQL